MSLGAGFIWDERVARHVYRDDHPLKPIRLVGVHDTLARLGAFARPGARVLPARQATRDEIERIHAPDYVEAVMQASADPDSDYSEWGMDPWGDTPPFAGMHEVSLLTTGATLVAMEEVILQLAECFGLKGVGADADGARLEASLRAGNVRLVDVHAEGWNGGDNTDPLQRASRWLQ